MIKNFFFLFISLISFLAAADKEIFVESTHAKLFCRIYGEGDPLIVIHGGPGLNQDYLLPQMQRLAEHNLVIFYDQRGCGQSTGDINSESMQIEVFLNDIEAIRKGFGFEKIAILGHSWGGFLAMNYAIVYPEKVDKLILLNSVPPSNEEFELFGAEWQKRTVSIQDELAQMHETKEYKEGAPDTIEHLYRTLFHFYCFHPEKANLLNLRTTATAALNGRKVHDFFTSNILSKPFNLHAKLQKLTMPTLIVHGDSDIIPFCTAQNTHKSIRESQFVLIPNCGHFPYVEESEVLFSALKRFLNEKAG